MKGSDFFMETSHDSHEEDGSRSSNTHDDDISNSSSKHNIISSPQINCNDYDDCNNKSTEDFLEKDPLSSQTKTNLKTHKPKTKEIQRRQTIDSYDLRQLVLRNNTQTDLHSKFLHSINLNKNQVIVDYNVLAFLENNEIEDNSIMEARMIKFISKLKSDYKSIQYIEYKIDNQLFCAIDLVYFLPILMHYTQNRDLIDLQRRTFEDIYKRLDSVLNYLMPASSSKTLQLPPTDSDSSSLLKDEEKQSTVESDRNIRLYQIGTDFYLMCRKKQHFVDGQKNIEKKYGKCKLLKTWKNHTDTKKIGKLILSKFPHLKWNARTNIISNSPHKHVSENELLNYLVKVIK